MARAGVRLVAGAVALLALVLWRARARGVPVWPGAHGRAVGSVALLMAIDVRVSGLLVIWVLAYVLFIRGFLKRVRGASGARM